MGKIASTSAMLAIEKLRIDAACIQCSVFRELRPEFINAENMFVDYKGIGKVPVGHTDMTIQGQFLESVVDRIENNITVPYVADADHIPLRGCDTNSIDEFAAFIDEARDRTFFTVDPHLCLDSAAKNTADKLGRLVEAFEKAAEVIARIKAGAPYVVELSIDECTGITTAREFSYLIEQFIERKLPVFSIAPAIGFDKKDADGPLLRQELRKCLPELSRIAADNGIVLGIHSGDGKSAQTLQTIAEATQGNIWYKVSPDRQRSFFRVLSESAPGSFEAELFGRMYDKLLDMTRLGVSSEDPDFADNCRQSLKEIADSSTNEPSTDCKMFHDFGFLLVKDFKEELDALPEAFIKRYYREDFSYIENLAAQLKISGGKHD